MQDKISIFWFRRDLRLSDNHGLFRALKAGIPVLPIFIFDTDILSQLDNKEDKRLDFIVQALQVLNTYLEKSGRSIATFEGKPLDIFKDLSVKYAVEKIFCNEDYEPYALKRDREIYEFLKKENIEFESFKDQVHFHNPQMYR